MKRFITLIAAAIISASSADRISACTGISLTSADGTTVVARTVEWAAGPMKCGYAVYPRGYSLQSFTPTGQNGIRCRNRYGFVGIYTEYEPFIVEGINETGLSASLFFFPEYGDFADYNPEENSQSLCDMQFVSWVLGNFSTIDEVKQAMAGIRLITLNHKIGSVHWRITEPGGRMVVLEVVDGIPRFYENSLGVLTNSPGFNWHITNLNNYVNLRPGSADNFNLNERIILTPLSGNSGMLGLPGDFTSPSRFVRAAFFQASAPTMKTGFDTVTQAFHILNCFDIPVGLQFPDGKVPENMPSATQFTAVSDLKAMRLYYRTAWNSTIRCIDLKDIDFSDVDFQSQPLDNTQKEMVQMIKIKK
jgi:choloylglycine hydrolase